MVRANLACYGPSVQSSANAPMETQMEIASAIELFINGTISAGKAAQLAGVDREAFMGLLGTLNIPLINYDASDLVGEIIDNGKLVEGLCSLRTVDASKV